MLKLTDIGDIEYDGSEEPTVILRGDRKAVGAIARALHLNAALDVTIADDGAVVLRRMAQ